MGSEPNATGERVLVLLPDRDSPPRRDYAGAFRPAASALVQHLAGAKVEVVEIPVPTVDPVRLTITGKDKQAGYEAAARATIAALSGSAYTRAVFLCHGWATGLQLGLRSAKQRGADAAHLARCFSVMRGMPLRSIALFACSAGDAPGSSKSAHGDGRGSFAELLTRETGVPTLTHWTAGHTVRNPDLILFAPGEPGAPLYERGTPAYRRARSLLTSSQPTGKRPPKGHTRPAWASLALCSSVDEARALLASEPG